MNDAMAALYAAAQGVGVLAISGTGSIAVGRSAAGEVTRSGGHPTSVFGEEGSGRWMALHAIRYAAKWVDGCVPESPLITKINNFFDGFDANKLSECGKRYRNEPVEYDIAVLTYEAAKEGDTAAREIILRGARELFLTAETCVKKLKFDAEPHFTSGVWGSVFVHNHIFFDEYNRLFEEHYPNCEVVLPKGDAADGALGLAFDYLDGKAEFIHEL
jgi:N-acetylglucosamine kinase-like BadF-type ATPase